MKLVNKTLYDTETLRRLFEAIHRDHAKTEGRHNQWDKLVVTVRTGGYSGCARLGRKRMRLVGMEHQPVTVHGTEIIVRLPKPIGQRTVAADVISPTADPCEHCGVMPARTRIDSPIKEVHLPDGSVVELNPDFWVHYCRQHKKNAFRASTALVAHLFEHELRHSYGERHRRGHSCMESTWKNTATHVEACKRYEATFGVELPLTKPKVRAPRDLQGDRYQRVLEREKAWSTKLKRAQTALKKLRQQRRYYEKQMAARKP